MNKRIIAIDPSGNGTTGIFYAELDNDLTCIKLGWDSCDTHTSAKDLDCIRGWFEKEIKFPYLFELYGTTTYCSSELYIVIEDYKDRGVTRDSSTSKFISKIQSYAIDFCKENEINLVEIKLQQPSIKALITNDYLRKNNLISKTKWIELNLECVVKPKGSIKYQPTTRHVLDAFRHWIYYCNKKFFKKQINFKKVFQKFILNE